MKGSFNNWTEPVNMYKIQNNNLYAGLVEVKSDMTKFEYKFIIDGNIWLSDDTVPKEDNGNNIHVIEKLEDIKMKSYKNFS